MKPAQTLRRTAAVVLTVAAMLLTMTPAQAADRVQPRAFTGYGFDTFTAPSQAAMDAWLTASPFWAVGIYIAGANRFDPVQPNLDATWVREQARKGWRLLPIVLGPQAACSERDYKLTISRDPANGYAKARVQGRVEAARSVRRARALGIGERSTLWYDIEHFDTTRTGCRRSVLSFLSAWTNRLHDLNFTSGVYSSASSGIAALDNADAVSPGAYTMPDRIWFGWSNGRADTFIDPRWARSSSWRGNRVHQYVLDTSARYGGVTMHIDRNFLEVGGGTRTPRPVNTCGVRADFPTYRQISLGSRSEQVKAAQCLLRQKGFYGRPLTLRYTRATYRAVRSFQRARDLRVTGTLTRSGWTALHADGRAPILKRGSAGHPVRRVQRALNAATTARVPITGVFGADTTAAVQDYQRARSLPRTGVVAGDTWASLRRGLR